MPRLYIAHQHKHRSHCDNGAEPVMGCIEAFGQTESNEEEEGQCESHAAQYSSRSQHHQPDRNCCQTGHCQIWYPDFYSEPSKQQAVDQIRAWSEKLKIITVGHLSCQYPGAIG